MRHVTISSPQLTGIQIIIIINIMHKGPPIIMLIDLDNVSLFKKNKNPRETFNLTNKQGVNKIIIVESTFLLILNMAQEKY